MDCIIRDRLRRIVSHESRFTQATDTIALINKGQTESNEDWKFMCKSERVAMAGGNRTKVNRLCCGSCQIQDVSVGVGVRDQKLFCFC